MFNSREIHCLICDTKVQSQNSKQIGIVVGTMATNILPHKALKSIDSMYYCLKDKLNSSKQCTDLIPFINVLSNVDNLKNILNKLLDQQYEKEKEKENEENNSTLNKIKSLFLSLYSIH